MHESSVTSSGQFINLFTSFFHRTAKQHQHILNEDVYDQTRFSILSCAARMRRVARDKTQLRGRGNRGRRTTPPGRPSKDNLQGWGEEEASQRHHTSSDSQDDAVETTRIRLYGYAKFLMNGG